MKDSNRQPAEKEYGLHVALSKRACDLIDGKGTADPLVLPADRRRLFATKDIVLQFMCVSLTRLMRMPRERHFKEAAEDFEKLSMTNTLFLASRDSIYTLWEAFNRVCRSKIGSSGALVLKAFIPEMTEEGIGYYVEMSQQIANGEIRPDEEHVTDCLIEFEENWQASMDLCDRMMGKPEA